MSTMFKRVKENFTCEKCGRVIVGDGYTNHCPHCLWSKHVDVYPGDRSADCGGMMKPVDVTTEKGEHIVTHECVVCGHQKRNKTSWHDNFETLLMIVKGVNGLKNKE